MARRSRSRDLAGLAALGALGYMAMRGDKQAPAPVEDRVGKVVSPTSTQDASGAGTSSDDTGDFLSRRLRINPETGEAYSMDNLSPMSASARTAVASTPAPVLSDEAMRGRGTNRAPVPAVIGPRSTGRGGATAEELTAYERAQRGAGAGRSTGRGGATAAELAEYQRQQERDRMRGRGYGTTYKKGGAVKVKKMASGGMTSASKRADGIATKGKTKCKMY